MIPIAMGLFSNIGISMTPMFGSIAMIFSSLTVVLNTLQYYTNGMANALHQENLQIYNLY